MRVTVIGANGFVGSAFVRYLSVKPEIELIPVTRQSYLEHAGKRSDVVIEAACNSKKYLSDKEPLVDFEASVTHRFRTLTSRSSEQFMERPPGGFAHEVMAGDDDGGARSHARAYSVCSWM